MTKHLVIKRNCKSGNAFSRINVRINYKKHSNVRTMVITVLMASAVASSLEGVSTRVLPKYLRVNLASDASSDSSPCVVLVEPPPSTHSRLFAKAHSSHSSES